jgi:hypothetical protein
MRGLTRMPMWRFNRIDCCSSRSSILTRISMVNLNVHCKDTFNCCIILLTFCIASLCLILSYVHRVSCSCVWYCIQITLLSSCPTVLYLHRAACRYGLYYCIDATYFSRLILLYLYYVVTSSVVGDVVACEDLCLWRNSDDSDEFDDDWWITKLASSYGVVGLTNNGHHYGQYKQRFHWQHIEGVYSVMQSSIAERRNKNSKYKFLHIITYYYVHVYF